MLRSSNQAFDEFFKLTDYNIGNRNSNTIGTQDSKRTCHKLHRKVSIIQDSLHPSRYANSEGHDINANFSKIKNTSIRHPKLDMHPLSSGDKGESNYNTYQHHSRHSMFSELKSPIVDQIEGDFSWHMPNPYSGIVGQRLANSILKVVEEKTAGMKIIDDTIVKSTV